MGNREDRIAIITLYHENWNFGGLLQAYALPTALKKLFGVSAEQIDYVLCPAEPKKDEEKAAVSLKHFIYTCGYLLYVKLETKNFLKRRRAFEQFIDDIPHSPKSYQYHSISSTLGNYTTYICGGDQIWNDYQIIKWYQREDSEVFTLQFVPEHIKKVSYAPSMAVLELTDGFKAQLRSALHRLDHISVREKSSVAVLKTITDRPIEVVVDPVLLLRAEEWAQAARCPRRKGKYLLCYLLGDSISQRKVVTKLAKALGLQIVTFPHILCDVVRKCDLFFGDVHDYTSGPREFLGLIQNAELVITDSFHACVFSMIFQTPFAVFERSKPGEKGNMNSRVYDFLEEYHLQQQLVTEQTLSAAGEIPHVDFTYAHAHWKTRRAESIAYLENALKDEI